MDENPIANLIGVDKDSDPKKNLGDARPEGICGITAGLTSVDEQNQRGADHFHATLKGGATPALHSDTAHDPEMSAYLLAALDTS